MRIRSEEHTYTVIAVRRRSLLAENEAGLPRLLLPVKEPGDIRALAPVFLDWKENGAFSDFIESFPHDGGLWAVFAHHVGTDWKPLPQALEGASAQARAMALRSLIGALITASPPYSVMCGALRRENLYCSAACEVRFVYELDLRGIFDGECQARAYVMLAEAARSIFRDTPNPAAERFAAELESARFKTVEEAYAGFAEAFGEASTEHIAPKKPSIKERGLAAQAFFQEKIASMAGFLALTAGIILLIWLFFHTVISPPPTDNGITQIGTEPSGKAPPAAKGDF